MKVYKSRSCFSIICSSYSFSFFSYSKSGLYSIRLIISSGKSTSFVYFFWCTLLPLPSSYLSLSNYFCISKALEKISWSLAPLPSLLTTPSSVTLFDMSDAVARFAFNTPKFYTRSIFFSLYDIFFIAWVSSYSFPYFSWNVYLACTD